MLFRVHPLLCFLYFHEFVMQTFFRTCFFGMPELQFLNFLSQPRILVTLRLMKTGHFFMSSFEMMSGFKGPFVFQFQGVMFFHFLKTRLLTCLQFFFQIFFCCKILFMFFLCRRKFVLNLNRIFLCLSVFLFFFLNKFFMLSQTTF